VMSALEVPGGVLEGDVVAIVAVDAAGEEHRFTVHTGVLESVEYFQARERWRMLQGHAANGMEVRLELPPGCGRDGLAALLRRLYARRPWPPRAWAEVGPEAARGAAVLADMWLLGDVAQEARPQAGPVLTIEDMRHLLNTTASMSDNKRSAVAALCDHQVEVSDEFLDTLIETRKRYVQLVGLHSWKTCVLRGCKVHPDRIAKAMSTVLREFQCWYTTGKKDYVSQLLDAALVARIAGDLSGEFYDKIILDFPEEDLYTCVVSTEMILAMQAEARAILVRRDMRNLLNLSACYVSELVAAIKAIDLGSDTAPHWQS